MFILNRLTLYGNFGKASVVYVRVSYDFDGAVKILFPPPKREKKNSFPQRRNKTSDLFGIYKRRAHIFVIKNYLYTFIKTNAYLRSAGGTQ